MFKRDAASTDAHGAGLEAADVQDVEGDDVALADFAEHVFDRHLAVVEDDGAGRRSANAHLVFFGANGEAGKSLFNQERGELFTIDLGEDGEQVGETGIGDPHLFAVEDVVFTIGRNLGSGTAVQSVRAG